MTSCSSIFADIPSRLPAELCQTLHAAPTARIERIVSRGHASDPDAWYDQTEDEWVIVLQGRARLAFPDRPTLDMQAGDYLLLPAHCRHRVDWTDPDTETVWLAIHLESKSTSV
ncbi:cupin domain-containing protein [Methylococcaceae bacterium WWC4]|nr:cupin domain-containing protein [Methylococcaceae bacterium WWC4]